MKFQRNRKAFSMVTAIFTIILMASVAMLVMSMSGKMVKETTTQFQREQAMLLAKSYTEYAIMAVMANDRNGAGTCLETINGDDVIRSENDGGFEVRVQIHYMSNGTDGTLLNIDNVNGCPAVRVLGNAANTTLGSPLNIIVDVYVKYKELDGVNANFITYHKRTLQKI